MQFTPGTFQDDGNRITSEAGDFFAVRTPVGWGVYYTGYTNTGQLIGDVIGRRFVVNPAGSISLPVADMVSLTCMVLSCCFENDLKAERERGSDNELRPVDNQ